MANVANDVELQSTDLKKRSFMRSLCMGMVEEEMILPFPRMKDEDRETLTAMFTAVEQVLKGRDADYRKWDRAGEMPPEFLNELKQAGLFGLITPEEFGGLGLKSSAYSRFVQELGRHDASVAITVGAHNSIGMRGLVLFGNDEQKKRFFPVLASGEMIAAFCLTEPGAGSDAASIKTFAKREGDDWILDGTKMWITNGGIADFFTVFARTDTPEGKMTAFIVTKDLPGVSIGSHEDKMGLRASSTTTVSFDHVKVPAANVLGGVGQGFKVAMKILNNGRTGLGGGCVGGMKKLITLSAKQAQERVQFGKPIVEYGLIKQKLGHMVVECYVSEAVVGMVAGLMDLGFEDYAVEAAISKVFATECLWRTADEALQIAGGNGYSCEFPYERYLRDSRVNRIFEGTNEVMRLFIALTAMQDVGKGLKELSSSLEGIFKEPIKGFGVLSDYAQRKASFAGVPFFSEKTKFSKLSPKLKPFADTFADLSRDMASAADRILRKHGKNIIGKQFATKRLADIMIDLFTLACTLSRVDAALRLKGDAGSTKEMEILLVFSNQVRRRVKSNLGKIDDNDDEAIKSLADHAVESGGFTWDVLD